MGTRTLVLLRHGQFNVDEGGVLTPLGREQARLSGAYLEALPIDAIWSSTLPRAKETAAIVAAQLARGHTVRHVDVLREGLYTRVEGYNVPPAERKFDRDRAEAAYVRFFRPSRVNRVELLVCHGNLIRYLLCRALRTSVVRWLRMATTHCGISRIYVRSTGAVRVVSYNEHSHLPTNLVT